MADKTRRKGQTPAFIYNIVSLLRMAMPRPLAALRRRMLLRGWERRPDADYIRSRVDYYCRRPFVPNPEAITASGVKLGICPSAYIYDVQEFLRAWPADTPLNFYGHDIWENPKVPTIMKGRRIDSDTDNGVILKLDRRRHFIRPVDPVPFAEKKPMLLFRGECHGKPHRKRFLDMWKDSPLMDIGDTSRDAAPGQRKEPVALTGHFDYKFILALEGNDVATAVQWIMASNCVAVMPRPTVETWFMHAALRPGEHYVEIASDYSDAEEKLRYYIDHPEEAAAIAEASTRWARQFSDTRRERIISYLVLNKYFAH